MVAPALQRAAERGVACRLLVDGVGSRAFLGGSQWRALRASGVRVVEALPVGVVRLLFRRIDLRNHRKIAVIDPFSVALTKKAINRTYDIMGMREALGAALDVGSLIEAAVVPEREEFMSIARSDGLKAAIAWRDARFSDE